jgi:hypothetical protein
MLFLVNSAGAPSIAKFIRVSSPGKLQFAAASFSVNEDAGTATITVLRSVGTAGVVSTTVSTQNRSAVAGEDYTNTIATVSFADGDMTPKTVTVPIVDDIVVEGNETVSLSLSKPTGKASLGTPGLAELTIVDNDNQVSSLSTGDS